MRNILSLKNKKGSALSKEVVALLGVVFVVILIVGIGPTLFNGTGNISGAPTYFNTIFPFAIGIGITLFVIRILFK